MQNHLLGSIAALTSAASWALGMVLWRKIGHRISAQSINLSKCIIGLFYLGFVLMFVKMDPVSIRAMIALGISGLLGITLSDTFFFKSLMYLGSRLSSVMGMLAPVLIAVSSVIFLGDRPSIFVWGGILLVVSGVGWVVWERTSQEHLVADRKKGIYYAALSLLCMTAAVILSKIGVSSVPAIEGTFIRILWGVAGLFFWGVSTRRIKEWLAPLSRPDIIKQIFFVTFIGTFGGFYLSLLALKYLNASVAGALNSTEPIFVLPMVMIVFGENISMRALFGACVAVAGVSLIIFGG